MRLVHDSSKPERAADAVRGQSVITGSCTALLEETFNAFEFQPDCSSPAELGTTGAPTVTPSKRRPWVSPMEGPKAACQGIGCQNDYS